MPTHLSAGADLERVPLTADEFVPREWLAPERMPSIVKSIARIYAQERRSA